jgi:GDPmannose 4,6-dehydratase
MWLMLQQNEPKDYVIATGKTHTVREFVNMAFDEVGFVLEWSGKGLNEVAKDAKTGKVLVSVDPRHFRPAEVELLLGDPTKAENELGWTAKTTLQDLVSEMVQYDLHTDSYGG